MYIYVYICIYKYIYAYLYNNRTETINIHSSKANEHPDKQDKNFTRNKTKRKRRMLATHRQSTGAIIPKKKKSACSYVFVIIKFI